MSKRLIRVLVYASLLMALPGAPSYDWRDAIAKIVNAAQTYQPSASGITAPNVYTPGTLGTPGATAPPVLPNGVLGHYVTPDYESLIRGDPGYQGVRSAISAQESTAGRTRADMVRRAIAQFGAAPAGWQSGYGDVDQASLAAAQQNPFSTVRQLQDARSHGSADLAAALGARGMLSSGALTGGEQLLQREYDRSTADATSRLLAALGGYEGDYASAFGNLEGQGQQAYADAAGRVAQMNPAQFVADPIYQGPNGQPVQPVTYQGIGATPEPIGPQPLQGAITPGMVAPPDTSLLAPVQPPVLRRNRRFDMINSYGV